MINIITLFIKVIEYNQYLNLINDIKTYIYTYKIVILESNGILERNAKSSQEFSN